jgi:hypothetical protein
VNGTPGFIGLAESSIVPLPEFTCAEAQAANVKARIAKVVGFIKYLRVSERKPGRGRQPSDFGATQKESPLVFPSFHRKKSLREIFAPLIGTSTHILEQNKGDGDLFAETTKLELLAHSPSFLVVLFLE